MLLDAAPGLFATTIGSDIKRCPAAMTARLRMSPPPPTPECVTNSIGLLGNPFRVMNSLSEAAKADVANAERTSKTDTVNRTRINFFVIAIPSY